MNAGIPTDRTRIGDPARALTPEQLQDCSRTVMEKRSRGEQTSIVDVAQSKGYLARPGAAPAGSTRVPRRIGPYEIGKLLGKGAMGEVYLAVHADMRQKVALKILPLSLSTDEEALQRFLREARAAASLDHPNIVRALHFGEDQGVHFLALEFVDGEPLAETLKRVVRLQENAALKITLAVAQALDHAHKAGLVHRDIKPANILISKTGKVKLADLGLARRMGSDSSLTQSGMALGTPLFISPEQANGQRDVDIRSDIYSLGATLYFALTGKPPFEADNPVAVLAKHLTEPLKPPILVNPGISEGANSLVMRMMVKDRDQRIRTPAKLIEEIQAALAAPAPARATSLALKAARAVQYGPYRAIRPWLPAIAAAAILMGGFAAWAAFGRGGPRQPNRATGKISSPGGGAAGAVVEGGNPSASAGPGLEAGKTPPAHIAPPPVETAPPIAGLPPGGQSGPPPGEIPPIAAVIPSKPAVDNAPRTIVPPILPPPTVASPEEQWKAEFEAIKASTGPGGSLRSSGPVASLTALAEFEKKWSSDPEATRKAATAREAVITEVRTAVEEVAKKFGAAAETLDAATNQRQNREPHSKNPDELVDVAEEAWRLAEDFDRRFSLPDDAPEPLTGYKNQREAAQPRFFDSLRGYAQTEIADAKRLVSAVGGSSSSTQYEGPIFGATRALTRLTSAEARKLIDQSDLEKAERALADLQKISLSAGSTQPQTPDPGASGQPPPPEGSKPPPAPSDRPPPGGGPGGRPPPPRGGGGGGGGGGPPPGGRPR